MDFKRLEKWPKPWIVQPKLDGDRCRAVFDLEGKVTLYSSESKVKVCVPHIVKELEESGLKDLEFDGELYIHGWKFESIREITGRTINLHPDYLKMQFHIFDLVSEQTQLTRRDRLLTFYSNTAFAVSSWFAFSTEDLERILTEQLKEGYEGVVVRNPNGLYKRKRSTDIMKWKPTQEDTYLIVGYEEEISIHGDPKDSLGALICSRDAELFNVGTGFTREQRQQLWKTKEDLKGKLVKIRYKQLTRYNIPREPVFLEIVD